MPDFINSKCYGNVPFHVVNKGNKKYHNFKAVCRLVSIPPPEELTRIISGTRGMLELALHNPNTAKSYRMRIISRTDAEYLMELYEAMGGADRVIFRNWVSLARPKNRKRMPAVSAILGTVMLIEIAGVSDGLLDAISIEEAAVEGEYIKVRGFEARRVGGGHARNGPDNDKQAGVGLHRGGTLPPSR